MGVIVLWPMGIIGGFCLQQCVGEYDKESFVSSVPTMCYGIVFTGTVFFWLWRPHLRPSPLHGSDLMVWLAVWRHTHKQTVRPHTHADHVVMSTLFWNQFAKSQISLCLVSLLILCRVCFIMKRWFFRLWKVMNIIYSSFSFCLVLTCYLHYLLLVTDNPTHPRHMSNDVGGSNYNCEWFTFDYFIVVLVK